MATEVGLIQIFGACAVLTVLFYWCLLCFYAFLLYFLYFKIFGIKNDVFREFRFLPEFHDFFLFSVSQKTGDSTLYRHMYNTILC